MADLNDLNNQANQGDGYFKEELKVDVGSFSLDMLDAADDDEEDTAKDDTATDASVKTSK